MKLHAYHAVLLAAFASASPVYAGMIPSPVWPDRSWPVLQRVSPEEPQVSLASRTLPEVDPQVSPEVVPVKLASRVVPSDPRVKPVGIGVQVESKVRPLGILSKVMPQVIPAELTGKVPAKPAVHPLKVNINQADLQTLMSFSGIGPKIAAAVIAYREAHGPFHDIQELKNVRGVTPKLFSKIEESITV